MIKQRLRWVVDHQLVTAFILSGLTFLMVQAMVFFYGLNDGRAK
ncbi:hypothetical protein [Loigolactobacillus binensis]|uniref:ABC transporter permease n=1 Tax=Loigolactobacillus binensis TaxID=2559922 RepID=A0ABW3EFV8_9LACO|nr:hypothetical protein [Loigolactobacillus binensis]